jgi:hypothetical protein
VNAAVDTRHIALLGALVGHDVRFVLVGGVALQVRGFSGATRDVDVTIAADVANAQRLDAALNALHADPFLAGERGTAYRTDHGQLEVMRWTDGVGDYGAWMRNASQVELAPGLTVRVGGASDLLLSKEQAGREKDSDALPQIRAELLAGGELTSEDVRGPVAELPVEVIPDARIEEQLGPRPTDRRLRGLWDHGAQLITDYRERWSVPDDGPFLGAVPPATSDQASDREALDRQLDRLRRLANRGQGSIQGSNLSKSQRT